MERSRTGTLARRSARDYMRSSPTRIQIVGTFSCVSLGCLVYGTCVQVFFVGYDDMSTRLGWECSWIMALNQYYLTSPDILGPLPLNQEHHNMIRGIK